MQLYSNFDFWRFSEYLLNIFPGSFSADIATVHFHVAHMFDDHEDVCWAWGKLLSDALEVHVPVKRSISKRQHVPFTTPQLLGPIRHRNKLRKLYFKSKDPADWEKYRLQRNLTSSLIQREIFSYLWSRADSAKGDPEQFWHTIKPFTHCKKVTMKRPINLRRMAHL